MLLLLNVAVISKANPINNQNIIIILLKVIEPLHFFSVIQWNHGFITMIQDNAKIIPKLYVIDIYE
ncbi:hypothetical protein GCM10009114_26990 [Aliiglaciecola litoralis]|uniref:Uncharacterized protein n=1 Tax=Aliiglaciecola litoralis TaxID=582857 RepID=A0ABP3WZP6_9ALTE